MLIIYVIICLNFLKGHSFKRTILLLVLYLKKNPSTEVKESKIRAFLRI